LSLFLKKKIEEKKYIFINFLNKLIFTKNLKIAKSKLAAGLEPAPEELFLRESRLPFRHAKIFIKNTYKM
jgi:hypothetical protein